MCATRDRGAEVDAAPAEVRRPLVVARQRSGRRRVGHAGAVPVLPVVTPLGGLLEDLARLVRAQRDRRGRVARGADTSAAAPAALPVFSEPVVPSIEIELLPPYWVVLAPRK